MTKLCYAYCRVSGLSQTDGDGIPRQKAAIEAFAQREGYEVAQVWEEAWTGKELHRPAFQTMRGVMLANGVKTVVVEKLDRLSRNLLVQETIVADFKKHGLLLVSTQEPDLCSDDPSRVLFRQMMGAVAEYDRAMLVSRMKHGKALRKASGRHSDGRYAYGKHPAHPEEGRLIDRARHLRRNGFNLRQIAACLVDEGFKSRSGKKLHPMQVSRILRGGM